MYRSFGKRIFDLILVTLASPFCIFVALLVVVTYKISGSKEVFFVQDRMGKDNIPFKLYKFRTLSEDETLPLTERQFPLGNFLRLTSLDELPQVWNILRNEMSWIGPRPLPIAYAPLFSDGQRRRHLVKPGITGLAQVNGRTAISWPSKFSMDTYYVENLTLLLDVKIIFKTIVLLLSFRKDNSLEEKKFNGEQ